jgi:hypothetical protein
MAKGGRKKGCWIREALKKVEEEISAGIMGK